ncbi:diadenosine tetraphosphate hydrolase [Pseudanabaena sp. FACHB-2040]|uniref:HIT family protein n=1 Tax=Pseudanabaena sp. FACHB-2040 TaxID=2692859 RepID=UPI0016825E01|nr:diadenosine tetraphosphate hydrolase [Pseudanabaena sp. FACHB-2040]MBD2260493.1 diadenosine tetraphosphate hydrolase [Pseudanabaena sp. FACHB-2040]
MQHPDCLACQTLAGQVTVPGGTIAENEWWLADHCVSAYGVGAVVVKSKQHRENLWDLSSAESASLGPFLQQISQAISEALGAERVYVGLWVDQPPYHVHFVVQPRYPGKAELGLKGLELQVFRSLGKPPSATEMAEAAGKLKQYLQSQQPQT